MNAFLATEEEPNGWDRDELATKQFCKTYHQLKASVFRLWALFGDILSTFF